MAHKVESQTCLVSLNFLNKKRGITRLEVSLLFTNCLDDSVLEIRKLKHYTSKPRFRHHQDQAFSAEMSVKLRCSHTLSTAIPSCSILSCLSPAATAIFSTYALQLSSNSLRRSEYSTFLVLSLFKPLCCIGDSLVHSPS